MSSLLTQPNSLPGLFLIYNGAEFGAFPSAMGTNLADWTMDIELALIVQDIRSPSGAAQTAWAAIESARSRLVGLQIGAYNKLIPVSESLVFSQAGLLVYGLKYRLEIMNSSFN